MQTEVKRLRKEAVERDEIINVSFKPLNNGKQNNRIFRTVVQEKISEIRAVYLRNSLLDTNVNLLKGVILGK